MPVLSCGPPRLGNTPIEIKSDVAKSSRSAPTKTIPKHRLRQLHAAACVPGSRGVVRPKIVEFGRSPAKPRHALDTSGESARLALQRQDKNLIRDLASCACTKKAGPPPSSRLILGGSRPPRPPVGGLRPQTLCTCARLQVPSNAAGPQPRGSSGP